MKEEKKRRRKGRGGAGTEAHRVPTTGRAHVNRNRPEQKKSVQPELASLPRWNRNQREEAPSSADTSWKSGNQQIQMYAEAAGSNLKNLLFFLFIRFLKQQDHKAEFLITLSHSSISNLKTWELLFRDFSFKATDLTEVSFEDNQSFCGLLDNCFYSTGYKQSFDISPLFKLRNVDFFIVSSCLATVHIHSQSNTSTVDKFKPSTLSCTCNTWS